VGQTNPIAEFPALGTFGRMRTTATLVTIAVVVTACAAATVPEETNTPSCEDECTTSSSQSGSGGSDSVTASSSTDAASGTSGGTGGEAITVTVGVGGSTSAASSSASTGVVVPPECVDADDCPGVDNSCRERTCIVGKCGVLYASAGTKLSIPIPIPGDCAQTVCDGAGHVVSKPDPADLPSVGECATSACSPSPVVTVKATGTKCSTGLCKNGACVDHITVYCDVGNFSIVGCGPGESVHYSVLWSNPDGSNHYCIGSNLGTVDYCAPGTVCYGTLYTTQYIGVCVDGP
jgi:hypothetical protein